MAVYFFDSSALVKRYAVESGSDWVCSVADDENGWIYIATITVVEVTSAVTRRVRGRHLDRAEAARVLHQFDWHCDCQYTVVSFEDSDLDRACALASVYGLRAYDAVQLSMCLGLQQLHAEHEGPPITLVSADKELNDAARKEGLVVVNPEDERR